MKETKLQAGIKRPLRRPIGSAQGGLVKAECLPNGQSLPLVIQPVVKGVNVVTWAGNNREFIETKVLKHGAILFRDFNVNSVEKFEQLVRSISGALLPYQERSSPRSEVSANVYTSTDYPANQSIFPHNEHSYSLTFPLRLYFFCLTSPQEGGETPIADARRVFERISPDTRRKFLEKGWMYVRNFGDGFGLSWQTVFQTEDRTVVEKYCRAARIEFEWKEGNRLRTRQIRPVTAKHPRTGEITWFNHATFFHVSTMETSIRDALLAQFEEEHLPNNTYYGDGSPIEPGVLDELRAAYLAETVAFRWEQGDVLMVDNMLTAHSRTPFTGPRKILVAMAERFTREDL